MMDLSTLLSRSNDPDGFGKYESARKIKAIRALPTQSRYRPKGTSVIPSRGKANCSNYVAIPSSVPFCAPR